jgi:hypothetical protein
MDIWTLRWLLWGALFVVIELLAMRARRGTLSEQVWAWLAIGKPLTTGVMWRRIAFIALWGFLTLHFMFQWV